MTLDLHPHRAREDVADLLAGMHVPSGLDAHGDLGQDLDDFTSGNRGISALQLCSLQHVGKRIRRFDRR